MGNVTNTCVKDALFLLLLSSILMLLATSGRAPVMRQHADLHCKHSFLCFAACHVLETNKYMLFTAFRQHTACKKQEMTLFLYVFVLSFHILASEIKHWTSPLSQNTAAEFEDFGAMLGQGGWGSVASRSCG